MLKVFWQIWRAWIFGIVVLAIAIIAIVLSSPAFEACHNSGLATIHCVGVFIDQNHDSISAVSTVVIALFTISLWWATAGQYDLVEQQIKLSRAEFISTHRPRIILRDVHLVGQEVLYMLVNAGDTPATIVESWIMAEFVEQGARIMPLRSFDHDDLGRLVFAGGETKDLTYPLPNGVSYSIRWPETRRIGIEGKPPVYGKNYFVGTLVYADDLGVRRRSTFRRRWDDTTHTFVRLRPEEERDHEYAD